ncbi:phage tail protein, partial [Escherichia coli]|nr:phage tail protein [Escherichia coli]EFU7174782.1 phage tail protein [Escherichia coli]EJF6902112.1 phage tail protein [Escherichia coli]EJS8390383.1 phage tail protein [Escherichia coli]EJT7002678.1 phage tail protein [Escherichia coli]
IATVTLSGMVATVKGVKAGSTSIVGMTAGGAQVAVAGITVNGD